jgi:ABC-type sugar transport system substrate-binding protein
MTHDDLRMVEAYLDDMRMDRRQLLKVGAALGLGAAGIGAAVGAGAAGAATVASDALSKRFGWIIAANVPFFELSMTRWMKKSTEGTGYRVVTQSEDGSAVKAQQIMTNMLQQNYAFIAKADGVPPKPFEPLAKQARDKGILFLNHAVQAVGGAGQNIAFDHALAGKGIGGAAVAWAKKNGISQPVIGTLANLSDPEGVKRTSEAIKTVKAAFPNTKVAGQVYSVDQTGSGASGTANLLQADPDINMILTFNTVTGKEAIQAAIEAGKTDRNKFFMGMADTEEETQELIAAGDSIVQANWGALFEISAVLMIRDALNFAKGKKVLPTRGLGGRLLTNRAQVAAFQRIAKNPLGKAALPAYKDKTLVRYSTKALKSGQSINSI